MAKVMLEMAMKCHPSGVQHFPLLEDTIMIFLDWENINSFDKDSDFRALNQTITSFGGTSLDIRGLRLGMIAADIVNLLVPFNYTIAETVNLPNRWFGAGKEAQSLSLCGTTRLKKWEVAAVIASLRMHPNYADPSVVSQATCKWLLPDVVD